MINAMVPWPTVFTIEDVRCFHGEHRGQLRPITLLVGENSTGKSTFLGCYSVIHRLFSHWQPTRQLSLFDVEPDFNEDPFTMGSFREIVRTRRGPTGLIHEFKLGIGFEQDSQSVKRIYVGFREEGTQPTIASIRYECNDSYVELQRSGKDNIHLSTPDKQVVLHYPGKLTLSFLAFLDLRSSKISDSPSLTPDVINYIQRFMANWLSKELSIGSLLGLKLTSVAPLRSRPKRTYDPVREISSPEGEHVPMLMMRLSRSDEGRWGKLHDGLVTFGTDSGMFSDIKVKTHGRRMGDPFQLQVKVRSGNFANIMDVGYGVSQSLPILVDIMDARNQTFIMQQPEVHLHPRGQAELASLFVASAVQKRGGNRFLIETHSDYIIDRVRISVRQGRLPAKDVSILYFEPTGNEVRVHNITLDEYGNLQHAPTGYREFFAKETDRLLGFGD